MKITQNGMACCSVVVGRDATWLEHHAAQELRSYIQKISGAVLLVVPEHDAQSVPGGKILIGRPATHGMIRTFEKKAHVLPAQSDVENDCVALAVRGETLVISGSNERSVYYSVCHLLQTYFGVGFYFDGDSCTASPDMTLPDLTLVERSSFKFRHTVGQWVYNFGAFLNKEERRRELDMYARNKINSYRFYSWNTYVRKRTFQKMGVPIEPITQEDIARMRPCSLRAMQEISRSCVDLDEVQRKTGDAIASLTRNEAAYLTNGAAGGLTVCSAAVLALDSEEAYHALPETGARCEIIIQRAQRNQYDRSLAATGAKIVYAGEGDKKPSRRELEEAITERTAAVAYFIYHGRDASLPLEEVVEIAHRCGVPVIVDAAAQNPPVENLWRFTALGADMAIFSGGKTLRGPQDSGLVLGKREWIERCRRWGPPMDGVCRGCKTSREAMVGLYAAVKAYLAQDETAVQCALERACARFERTLRGCGFTRVWREQEGPVGQSFPRSFGTVPFGSAVRLAQLMRTCGIYIGAQEDNSILLNPLMLTSRQVGIVCEALKQSMREMKREENKNGCN